MKIIITISLIFFSCLLYGQQEKEKTVYDYPIPNTLENCFEILNKTMLDNEKLLIKTLPEDSIYFNKEFQYGTDFFHAWKIYEGSRLTKYFNKKGLFGANEIYETILISYHRYLNHEDINLEEQIEKHKTTQKQEQKEYLEKIQKDSINGMYIPKNLEDSFLQLDKILSTEDKNEIKNLNNEKETIKYHHGLGTWIRNNWGLWGGSRLQKYFLEKNVTHPDNMSALILEFYYDWLNDKNDCWQKWEKNESVSNVKSKS